MMEILNKERIDKWLDSILTSTNLQFSCFLIDNLIGSLENNKSIEAQLLSIILMCDLSLNGKKNFKNWQHKFSSGLRSQRISQVTWKMFKTEVKASELDEFEDGKFRKSKKETWCSLSAIEAEAGCFDSSKVEKTVNSIWK